MKKLILCILMIGFLKSNAQKWMAEGMIGGSCYNGDLSQTNFSFNRVGPALSLNLKYYNNSIWSVRGGISFANVSGDDKKNSDPELQTRNLSFKTNIIELNVCGELATLDPNLYFSYPYIFAGVGAFYFNPYTKDNQNNKVFLRPLSTEGQGLAAYPDRKKYSKIQFCIPFGTGWKYEYKNKWEFSYEFGYRLLFTDYLDDVSYKYVSLDYLSENVSPKSAELAYRKQNIPFREEGQSRGNPKLKDVYFFSGFKIAKTLGKLHK